MNQEFYSTYLNYWTKGKKPNGALGIELSPKSLEEHIHQIHKLNPEPPHNIRGYLAHITQDPLSVIATVPIGTNFNKQKIMIQIEANSPEEIKELTQKYNLPFNARNVIRL